MKYVTDRDFPNQYADGVNVGLCDTRDNTFSSLKEQLKELCDNLEKLLLIRVTLILTLRGYNLKDFLSVKNLLWILFYTLSGSSSVFLSVLPDQAILLLLARRKDYSSFWT